MVRCQFKNQWTKKKLKAILILLLSVSVSYKRTTINMQTTTTMANHQETSGKPIDILQQFDGLLKNHSIVVTDRENLTKLFECIVELCTQMPKTKLKAALKAATQVPKTKTKAQSKTKAQPNNKTNSKEVMVGPDGAADAPTIADLGEVGEVARGRGRPRKAATEIVTENTNATTAEKKRRGRPKKDKTFTISSNDDEDALIEKMMADVASMQKDEDHIPYPASAAIEVAVAEVEVPVTEVEVPVTEVAAPVMSDDDDDTDTDESLSPIIQPTFAFHPEGEVDVEKDVVITLPTKPVKEVKVKQVKEVKVKPVKEVKVKVKPVKEVKVNVKPVKEVKAKVNPVKETKAKVNPVKALASFSAPEPVPTPASQRHVENQEMNGGIYLTHGFPASSFTWNGKTYLRTELDNVYDNMTLEMVGVWDHVNHEVICAFDDDGELYFSDEE